jgi:hypothetical protein
MGKEVSATRNRLEKAFGYVPETPWAAYMQQQDAKLRQFAPSSVMEDTPINALGHTSTTTTTRAVHPAIQPEISKALHHAFEKEHGTIPLPVWDAYVDECRMYIQKRLEQKQLEAHAIETKTKKPKGFIQLCNRIQNMILGVAATPFAKALEGASVTIQAVRDTSWNDLKLIYNNPDSIKEGLREYGKKAASNLRGGFTAESLARDIDSIAQLGQGVGKGFMSIPLMPVHLYQAAEQTIENTSIEDLKNIARNPDSIKEGTIDFLKDTAKGLEKQLSTNAGRGEIISSTFGGAFFGAVAGRAGSMLQAASKVGTQAGALFGEEAASFGRSVTANAPGKFTKTKLNVQSSTNIIREAVVVETVETMPVWPLEAYIPKQPKSALYSTPDGGVVTTYIKQGKPRSTFHVPAEAVNKIPTELRATVKPNRKCTGVRWQNKYSEYDIRIDKGNPLAENPSQRVDHVCIRYKGKVVGRDGKAILQTDLVSNPGQTFESHIPLTEWLTWKKWYRP